MTNNIANTELIKDKDSENSIYLRCEKIGLCNSRMITYRANGSVKKSPLTQSST